MNKIDMKDAARIFPRLVRYVARWRQPVAVLRRGRPIMIVKPTLFETLAKKKAAQR